jgi:hypothetical protein
MLSYGTKRREKTDLVLNNFKSLQNKNVHFLNFSNHPMNLEKKYFKDNTHLNKNGAKFFSKFFSQFFLSRLSSNN